ncbi:metal ABC transporter substrate-binding protein [Roseitranquillus sediminis]|uniref:metal ABC transporter substrate-binding protein n=1 Tax=Roseitranquillus sediminis TaxID=2809051 RepID=UPI001D0CAA36|nr:metal ABC transporter substrate-binding protein [Roseitranquillus sediminis]MBM9596022.1 zinc ABC transporter substrate-binding protein [Roseitranquillus sediminis]
MIGRRPLDLAAVALLTFGAGTARAETLDVRTDSYPVAYFAERIAGDTAEVVLPVPADVDPAHWVPPIAEIATFQQADLVLLTGAGLADWTTRTSLPRSRTIDTSTAYADALIETEGVTHSHGPEGDHSHAGVAPFTWLDLDLATLQAEAVAEALARRLPGEAALFEANLKALAADLATLDAVAEEVGALAAGRPLLASHPRYQYLARRYGLALESVEWEADKPPGPEQLDALDALLEKHPATIMLWDADPGADTRQVLMNLGITSVVFPALANRPADGDFVTSFRDSLASLRAAIVAG